MGFSAMEKVSIITEGGIPVWNLTISIARINLEDQKCQNVAAAVLPGGGRSTRDNAFRLTLRTMAELRSGAAIGIFRLTAGPFVSKDCLVEPFPSFRRS